MVFWFLGLWNFIVLYLFIADFLNGSSFINDYDDFDLGSLASSLLLN